MKKINSNLMKKWPYSKKFQHLKNSVKRNYYYCFYLKTKWYHQECGVFCFFSVSNPILWVTVDFRGFPICSDATLNVFFLMDIMNRPYWGCLGNNICYACFLALFLLSRVLSEVAPWIGTFFLNTLYKKKLSKNYHKNNSKY